MSTHDSDDEDFELIKDCIKPLSQETESSSPSLESDERAVPAPELPIDAPPGHEVPQNRSDDRYANENLELTPDPGSPSGDRPENDASNPSSDSVEPIPVSEGAEGDSGGSAPVESVAVDPPIPEQSVGEPVGEIRHDSPISSPREQDADLEAIRDCITDTVETPQVGGTPRDGSGTHEQGSENDGGLFSEPDDDSPQQHGESPDGSPIVDSVTSDSASSEVQTPVEEPAAPIRGRGFTQPAWKTANLIAESQSREEAELGELEREVQEMRR